jgi:hypothetical protein
VIEKLPTAKNLFFVNLFPSQNYDSDVIRWILEMGTAGLTPFVAPGSPAPVMGDEGLYSEGSARAAYWKEKVFIDEVMLNNLREPLSQATYLTAERQLARKLNRLKIRCDRRKEWMIAKMLFDGTFSYQIQGGVKFTVNYGLPSVHQETLTGENVWWEGTSLTVGSTATPIQDIFDALVTYRENTGGAPNYAMCNTYILRALLFNSTLQTLLQKSAFGDGDLFARPAQVLGSLLGIGTLAVYDEMHEVGAWLTSNCTTSATVVVDDATDFEAGAKARMYDMSEPYTWEDVTISSVAYATNTITLSASTTGSYLASQDRIVMRKKYVPDTKFVMFNDMMQGEKIAEFMYAPYGNNRHWNMFTDQKEEWDPEGIWIRAQNKGLPVLYHPDAIYQMTVADAS